MMENVLGKRNKARSVFPDYAPADRCDLTQPLSLPADHTVSKSLLDRHQQCMTQSSYPNVLNDSK